MVGVAWTWRGECERSLSRRRPARSQANREWSARGAMRSEETHTDTSLWRICLAFPLPCVLLPLSVALTTRNLQRKEGGGGWRRGKKRGCEVM